MSRSITVHIKPFAINNESFYNHNVYNTLYTFNLLVFKVWFVYLYSVISTLCYLKPNRIQQSLELSTLAKELTVTIRVIESSSFKLQSPITYNVNQRKLTHIR